MTLPSAAVFVATSGVGNRLKKLIERADLGDTLAAFEGGYEQVFVKVAITSGSAGTRQFNRGMLDGLLRTGCAAVNPDFYLRHGIWPGERRQCAAFPWTPTPADKIVVRDVVKQVLEGSSAILLRILDLPAKLAR